MLLLFCHLEEVYEEPQGHIGITMLGRYSRRCQMTLQPLCVSIGPVAASTVCYDQRKSEHCDTDEEGHHHAFVSGPAATLPSVTDVDSTSPNTEHLPNRTYG